MHPNLLREAAVRGSGRARLHVKLIHNDLEDIKLLCFEVSEKLLISLISCVKVLGVGGIHRGRDLALLLINLFKEAITTVVQLDYPINLPELLHVGISSSLLSSVIAFVHHIRVVDFSTPQYSYLVKLLLAIQDGLGAVLVS